MERTTRKVKVPETRKERRRHDYLCGWVEAISVSFADDDEVTPPWDVAVALNVPTWVRKELVRRGWIAYQRVDADEGAYAVRITPTGFAALLEFARSSGLAERHSIDTSYLEFEASRPFGDESEYEPPDGG